MFNNRTILITGGSGSFGNEAVNHILENYTPKKIIIYSRGELKQYKMQERWPDDGVSPMRYFIGDIRDKDRLWRALEGVDFVIHAAAMKQVPACEYNPIEAIKTNVIGAQNLIECAIDRKVWKVIALSSDKACNPINLYGATKLCSDKLFVAANVYSGGHDTIFSVVRYGNVMSSRGSVIPLFQKCVKERKPIPITHKEMTRFWITLPEAVKFVAFCFREMQGGEIFVPKIPSMQIMDLAEAIAGKGYPFLVTGIRPGEKIHEVMISEDDSRKTQEYPMYYKIITSPVVVSSNPYSSDKNDKWISVPELREIIKK